jgi:hypothetical protein
MIIGLTGKKGSGKDTVAAHLIKEYGFERRAFADPLKKSVAALFGIPYHKVDEWKNDPSRMVYLANDFIVTQGVEPFADEIASEMPFGEFLQHYGTRSHRDIFGLDFWVDQTLPKDGFYAGRKIVVTDLRFENEAHRIKFLQGFVVEITRPDLEDSTARDSKHESEQPLPRNLIDWFITNDTDIPSLQKQTEVMLTELGTKADFGLRLMGE